MGYLLDRQEGWRDTEIVAIVPLRRRSVRSRVVLRDGSLRETLTRPVTLRRRLDEGARWPNEEQPPNR